LETEEVGIAYGAPHMGGVRKIQKNKYLKKVKLLEFVSAESSLRRGEYVTEYTRGFIGNGVQMQGEENPITRDSKRTAQTQGTKMSWI